MKEYTVNEAREILTKYLGNDRLYCLRVSKCEQCVFNGDTCTAKFFDNEYLAKAESEIEKREEQVDWSKVEVDTKILVRNNENDEWSKRYFAKYEDGRVWTFADGATSWSDDRNIEEDPFAICSWNYAKLAVCGGGRMKEKYLKEIIFRGKQLANNEWIYGNLIITKDNKYFITKERDSAETFCFGVSCIEVNPETVCQFVGLKDKNETKIFEGDIVKIKYGGNFIVEYDEIYAKYEFYNPKTKATILPICIEDHEIIGNIFDNPELIGRMKNE